MRDIFYQRYRGYDSSVRSQALKLLLSSSSSLSDADVAELAVQSTDPSNTDYCLYIQARLFDAAQRNQTIRSETSIMLPLVIIIIINNNTVAICSALFLIFYDLSRYRIFGAREDERTVLYNSLDCISLLIYLKLTPTLILTLTLTLN